MSFMSLLEAAARMTTPTSPVGKRRKEVEGRKAVWHELGTSRNSLEVVPWRALMRAGPVIEEAFRKFPMELVSFGR